MVSLVGEELAGRLTTRVEVWRLRSCATDWLSMCLPGANNKGAAFVRRGMVELIAEQGGSRNPKETNCLKLSLLERAVILPGAQRRGRNGFP